MKDDSFAVARFGIGQPMRRIEDFRFITGQGRYVDDRREAGTLHAVFLRSPHAHARLVGVETSAAQTAPGVVAVFTAADLAAAGLGPLPAKPPIKQPDGSPVTIAPRPALATARVRYVGEPVAMIVAESLAAAEDALELVEVEYESLPAVALAPDALAEDAPLLFDDIPGNLGFRWEVGDAAKVRAAMAGAVHVTTVELRNNRLIPNSMEPRGCVARYDAAKDRFEFAGSIQNPFSFRSQLAEYFGWKAERLRCYADDVGGGFGAKNQLQPENVMLLFAAEKLRRPLKWMNDRAGSFQSDAHARDLFTTVKLGLDKAHKIVALEVETAANLGAYLSTNGALIPTVPTAAVLGGAYAIPAIYMHVRGAYTNTVPVDAYRGAGRPESIYLLERAVETAAREVGLAPAELRRRNLIAPTQLPYKTALGRTIDSGAFAEVLDRALERADAAGFPARAEAAKAKGLRRGLGLAYYLEATLGPPSDTARIAFAADGSSTLAVGTQSNGQGHETSFAQLAAAEFGIDPHRIAFRQADTDATPEGGGHGGSRSLNLGGTAVVLAARKIVEKGKQIAAHLLEAAAPDVEYAPGSYRISGTDRVVGFDDVVRAAFDPKRLPEGLAPGLDESARYEREDTNFPNGAHVCEIELEPATGFVRVVRYTVVDDFGRVINPLLVRGQVVGGIVQGVGQALYEEGVYDAESAQLLSGSFMDYCLPRADNLPPIEVELYEDAPTRTNPLGAKGCGEAGATGAPPAVVHAVLDALSEWRIKSLDMPLTPEKIWQAIEGAQP
jgi:carbon-monoxide dehydrogenase large subunit